MEKIEDKQFPKWEYILAVYCAPSNMNEWGKEGWELVQIVPTNSGDYTCIFKRRIS
jgi:hypothetical protein